MLRRKLVSSNFAALCPGSRPLLGRFTFLDLPRRDPANHNGGSDHVGGTLFALRTFGHLVRSFALIEIPIYFYIAGDFGFIA